MIFCLKLPLFLEYSPIVAFAPVNKEHCNQYTHVVLYELLIQWILCRLLSCLNKVNFSEQDSSSVKAPGPFKFCNSNNCLYNRDLFSMSLVGAGLALFLTITEPCPLVDGLGDRIVVIAVTAFVTALTISILFFSLVLLH